MSSESSKFVVFLDGIKLPKNIEKSIESEINEVVMRNLANLDLQDDVLCPLPRKIPIPWPGKIMFNLVHREGLKIPEIAKTVLQDAKQLHGL